LAGGASLHDLDAGFFYSMEEALTVGCGNNERCPHFPVFKILIRLSRNENG
jgi:hypothetical protein